MAYKLTLNDLSD